MIGQEHPTGVLLSVSVTVVKNLFARSVAAT